MTWMQIQKYQHEVTRYMKKRNKAIWFIKVNNSTEADSNDNEVEEISESIHKNGLKIIYKLKGYK
jgi:hypothetical protein